MIWERVVNWLNVGASCCLVTIRQARGSTPREAGARMAIGADGTYTGTIGGGALEWEAIAIARDLMAQHPDGQGTTRTFALGPSLAQCCGGVVVLRFEAFAPRDLEWIAALARAEKAGPFGTEGKPDARGVILRSIEQPGTAPLGEREEFGAARRDILLFGAGHVGRALILALAPLPFTVRWIDNREGIFPASLPRNAIVVPAIDPTLIAAEHRPDGIAIVATHSHSLDLEIVARLIKGNSFKFIGLIGSETKKNRFISRLQDMGIEEKRAVRLTCPIGLSGIRGKEPAVIAASVAAQMLMLPRAVNAPD